MASTVEICNLALTHIGVARISALTDDTEPARVCSLLYDPARESLLRLHPWGFAEKYEALAELTGIDVYGYEYAYQYPSDCLFARGFYRAVATADPIRFKIVAKADLSGKEIWTDEEDAVLIYTAQITDVNVFDVQFREALSHYLAAKLAPKLVKDEKLRLSLARAQLHYVAQAIYGDAREGFDNIVPISLDFFNEARL